MDIVVNETNRYHSFTVEHVGEEFSTRSHMRKWDDTNAGEMYTFLALTILMSHVQKLNVLDYWKRDSLIATPTFAKYMSRDRYLLLLRFLHFYDNEVASRDRLCKVRQVMMELLENFKNNFVPFQNVVIDESLILFKGRLALKKYIPSKRHRFGIKLFVMCDCETGMILDLIVYTGTDIDIPANDPHGVSGAVVKTVMQRLFGKGHVAYLDNWYSSPDLSKYLLQKDTGTVGIVKKSRKNMPKFSDAEKIEKFKSDDILVMK